MLFYVKLVESNALPAYSRKIINITNENVKFTRIENKKISRHQKISQLAILSIYVQTAACKQHRIFEDLP